MKASRKIPKKQAGLEQKSSPTTISTEYSATTLAIAHDDFITDEKALSYKAREKFLTEHPLVAKLLDRSIENPAFVKGDKCKLEPLLTDEILKLMNYIKILTQSDSAIVSNSLEIAEASKKYQNLHQLEAWLSSALTTEEQNLLSPFGFDPLPKRLQKAIEERLPSEDAAKVKKEPKKPHPIIAYQHIVDEVIVLLPKEESKAEEIKISTAKLYSYYLREAEYAVNALLESFGNKDKYDKFKLSIFIFESVNNESGKYYGAVHDARIFTNNVYFLFGSYQNSINYFKKFADFNAKQPIHDACLFILPKSNSVSGVEKKTSEAKLDWHPDEWVKLLYKFDKKVLQYLSLAVEIEAAMKKNGPSFENVTLKELETYSAALMYKDVGGYIELAKICNELKRSDYIFQECKKILMTQAKQFDLMPEITISGKDTNPALKHLTFKKLPITDPRGFFLGEYTGCCQSVGNVGRTFAIAGMTSHYSGFYVIVNKSDRIVAQMWSWVGSDGAVVLDSIESRGKNVEAEILPFIKPFAEELLKAGFTAIKVGTGGNTPRKLLDDLSDAVCATALGGETYSDASRQKLIYRKDSGDFLYQLNQSLQALKMMEKSEKQSSIAEIHAATKNATPAQLKQLFIHLYRSGYNLIIELYSRNEKTLLKQLLSQLPEEHLAEILELKSPKDNLPYSFYKVILKDKAFDIVNVLLEKKNAEQTLLFLLKEAIKKDDPAEFKEIVAHGRDAKVAAIEASMGVFNEIHALGAAKIFQCSLSIYEKNDAILSGWLFGSASAFTPVTKFNNADMLLSCLKACEYNEDLQRKFIRYSDQDGRTILLHSIKQGFVHVTSYILARYRLDEMKDSAVVFNEAFMVRDVDTLRRLLKLAEKKDELLAEWLLSPHPVEGYGIKYVDANEAMFVLCLEAAKYSEGLLKKILQLNKDNRTILSLSILFGYHNISLAILDRYKGDRDFINEMFQQGDIIHMVLSSEEIYIKRNVARAKDLLLPFMPILSMETIVKMVENGDPWSHILNFKDRDLTDCLVAKYEELLRQSPELCEYLLLNLKKEMPLSVIVNHPEAMESIFKLYETFCPPEKFCQYLLSVDVLEECFKKDNLALFSRIVDKLRGTITFDDIKARMPPMRNGIFHTVFYYFLSKQIPGIVYPDNWQKELVVSALEGIVIKIKYKSGRSLQETKFSLTEQILQAGRQYLTNDEFKKLLYKEVQPVLHVYVTYLNFTFNSRKEQYAKALESLVEFFNNLHKHWPDDKDFVYELINSKDSKGITLLEHASNESLQYYVSSWNPTNSPLMLAILHQYPPEMRPDLFSNKTSKSGVYDFFPPDEASNLMKILAHCDVLIHLKQSIASELKEDNSLIGLEKSRKQASLLELRAKVDNILNPVMNGSGNFDYIKLADSKEFSEECRQLLSNKEVKPMLDTFPEFKASEKVPLPKS